jgi:sulfur carrier protein
MIGTSVLEGGVMQVTVNGSTRDVPDGLTVQALVQHLGLTEGPVAVEVNRAIVPRLRHPEHRVAPGDVIEIVHFVGGG